MITTAQALATLEHRDNCGRPHMRTDTDPSGRVLTRCTACGVRVWHDEAPKLEPAPVVPDLSPYRCRDHMTPVTWKGTGCRTCAAEAKKRRQKRTPRPVPEGTETEWSFTDA